jgi:hypothetical protein
MFPPEKTDSPYELVQNILGSLSRGGGSFRQDVLVDAEEQDLVVTVGLTDAVPEGAKKPMNSYIRGYAAEAGWRATGLKLHKNYLRFTLAKASSKRR